MPDRGPPAVQLASTAPPPAPNPRGGAHGAPSPASSDIPPQSSFAPATTSSSSYSTSNSDCSVIAIGYDCHPRPPLNERSMRRSAKQPKSDAALTSSDQIFTKPL